MGSAKLGGALIAAAFLVYAGVETASWNTEAPIWVLSIVGTVLLVAGGIQVSKAYDPPKAVAGTVLAMWIVAFIIGRITMKWEPETPGEFRAFLGVATIQSVAYAVGAAVVLGYRGSAAVRVLSVVGIAGVLAYSLVVLLTFNAVEEGTLSFEDFLSRGSAAALLVGVMSIPGFLFAATAPPPAPAAPAPWQTPGAHGSTGARPPGGPAGGPWAMPGAGSGAGSAKPGSQWGGQGAAKGAAPATRLTQAPVRAGQPAPRPGQPAATLRPGPPPPAASARPGVAAPPRAATGPSAARPATPGAPPARPAARAPAPPAGRPGDARGLPPRRP